MLEKTLESLENSEHSVRCVDSIYDDQVTSRKQSSMCTVCQNNVNVSCCWHDPI